MLLYLPGGKAPSKLRENEDVLNFVRAFAESGKPIASRRENGSNVIEVGSGSYSFEEK